MKEDKRKEREQREKDRRCDKIRVVFGTRGKMKEGV